MPCLEESTVLNFVQGRLGQEEISKIEQHLDVCPSCRMVVAQAAECSNHDAAATFVEGRGRAAPVESDIVRASRQSAACDAPSASTLARGASVGRFLILQEIGAGGMGVVYAAYDPELDRKVAIKLLRWRALSEQVAHDTRIRFKREAQAMARLDHPNVISVHDVGVHGDQIFLAMELVEGWTFRGWLKEKHRGWQEILGVLRKSTVRCSASGTLPRNTRYKAQFWRPASRGLRRPGPRSSVTSTGMRRIGSRCRAALARRLGAGRRRARWRTCGESA